MASPPQLSPRVQGQIKKFGLPTSGSEPFIPALRTDHSGRQALKRETVAHGKKAGEVGFLDTADRVWIRDSAHANVPDHWDVQEDDGQSYFRVDDQGNRLP